MVEKLIGTLEINQTMSFDQLIKIKHLIKIYVLRKELIL